MPSATDNSIYREPTAWDAHQAQEDPPHDIPDSEFASLKSIPTKDPHRRKKLFADDIPNDRNAAHFRHTWWCHRRTRADTAMQHAGTSESQLERFRACGQNAFVFRSDKNPEKFRVQCDRCRNRWCEACQNERRLIIRRNLTEKLPHGTLRFITLTVKSNTDLRTCVDHLQESFKKLRAKPYFKQHLHGGIWFLEITRRKDNHEWHPHYHIIYTGEYIAKEKLSLEWHKVTGDSFIVDIRAMKDRKTAPHYVTKYASKAIAPEIWNDHDSLVELIKTFAHQKLIGTWGTWRGLKLCEVPESDEGWTLVAPLWQITTAAAEGDAAAQQTLSRLGKYNARATDHGNDEFDTIDTG